MGFGDVANPFGEMDTGVEEYQPPAVSVAAWEREPTPAPDATEIVEDDEPFTEAHLAAATQQAVPAIVSSSQTTGFGAPFPFTASVGPTTDTSGRMGPSIPSVTRIGSSPNQDTLLIPTGTPSSGPVASGSSPTDQMEDPSSFPLYNIKRYRTYFNVDTKEVLERIFWSVAFFFKGDFFDHIGGNPDL